MAHHSSIEIQISAHIQAPRNGRRIPEDIIRQAIIRRATTGAEIPGIRLSIVRWRRGPASEWHTAENSPDEWTRFARFLPSASLRVYALPSVRSR